MLFRFTGIRTGLEQQIQPGDTPAGSLKFPTAGEPGTIVTIGDGVWTAAAIIGGIIQRTGPTGAYADTTDTSANIIAALAGNAYAPDAVQGISFGLIVRNTVAFANTVGLGLGVRTIGGASLNIGASLVREFLFTIVNATPPVTLTGTTVNGNANVAFTIPPGLGGFPIGPAPGSIVLTPGMTISSTGVTAGTRILSVTQGPGGVTGVVMNAVATADGVASMTFMPTIGIDSIRSSTL